MGLHYIVPVLFFGLIAFVAFAYFWKYQGRRRRQLIAGHRGIVDLLILVVSGWLFKVIGFTGLIAGGATLTSAVMTSLGLSHATRGIRKRRICIRRHEIGHLGPIRVTAPGIGTRVVNEEQQAGSYTVDDYLALARRVARGTN